jgi:hypothetical protein
MDVGGTQLLIGEELDERPYLETGGVAVDVVDNGSPVDDRPDEAVDRQPVERPVPSLAEDPVPVVAECRDELADRLSLDRLTEATAEGVDGGRGEKRGETGGIIVGVEPLLDSLHSHYYLSGIT